MKKLVFIIVLALPTFSFGQNFNERDSLKSIIRILNGSVFSYRDTGISKEYTFYFNWQIKTGQNKAFGNAANVIYNGSKFIKLTDSGSNDTVFFRNKKLIMKGSIRFDYEIEILILNRDMIKFKIRDENDKILEYDLYKSNITIPKETRLWYGEKF